MEEYQQQKLSLVPAEQPEVPTDEEEEENELSSLLDHTLADMTDFMTEEEATEYIASILEGGEIEHETALFENVTPYITDNIKVTNYRPDQAVREASLAQKHMWRPGHGEVSYLASNTLEVYLGTLERPLEIPQALRQIRQLSESTVLTARIVLGLWNIRRHSDRVSKNGSAAVLLEEILQWQGAQKHSRIAHPGSTKRYSDGYRTEQKNRVLQDLGLLASCNVRGKCMVTVRGKTMPLEVDGQYIRYSVLNHKTQHDDRIIVGFLISPGDWIST